MTVENEVIVYGKKKEKYIRMILRNDTLREKHQTYMKARAALQRLDADQLEAISFLVELSRIDHISHAATELIAEQQSANADR